MNIFRSASHRAYESNALTNLANLLASRPGRLSDASRYAEAALAIDETLDPTAREIWKTYNILAQIAQKQGDADAARAYRLKERASYAAAPVSRHNLHRWGPLIVAIVKAAADPATRAAFEPMLAKMAARNWTSLVGALRRLLEGEHDEDALCASLDREDSLIVATVLRGIADPATLTEILPAEPDSDDRNQED